DAPATRQEVVARSSTRGTASSGARWCAHPARGLAKRERRADHAAIPCVDAAAARGAIVLSLSGSTGLLRVSLSAWRLRWRVRPEGWGGGHVGAGNVCRGGPGGGGGEAPSRWSRASTVGPARELHHYGTARARGRVPFRSTSFG